MTSPDLHARQEAWPAVLQALGGEYTELAAISADLVSELAEMSV